MSIVDFLKSKSRRCVRTKFQFRGGYIVNRKAFHQNDTFMELTHAGEGYIFYVDVDPACDQYCIRLLWTCPDVFEKQWTRSEAVDKNSGFFFKNIEFVYMLNLDNRNERYKFNDQVALWLRQKANPHRLFKFFSASDAQCQTDPDENNEPPKPESPPQRGDTLLDSQLGRSETRVSRKRSIEEVTLCTVDN